MSAEIILPRINETDTSPEEIPEISFRDFLKTREADEGTIIRAVKPSELFTYQTWLDENKIANVLNYIEDQSPELDQLTGYVRFHSKLDKNILVIGNGNHRALYALVSGRTVDLSIGKATVEHKDNPFRLSNLVKRYGNPFTNL